jgi:hypothetical protein
MFRPNRIEDSQGCLLLAAGLERDLGEHPGARHNQHRSARGAGLDFHPS